MSKKRGRRPQPVRTPRRLPGGFFSLERRVLTEDMRGDGAMVLIWTTLIGWANPADGQERVRGQQVFVKRGQLITGLDELSDEWQLSRSTVRRCLTYLQKTSRIDMQISNHGRIITVLNFDRYQRRRDNSATDSADDRQATGKRQASDRTHKNSLTVKQLNSLTSIFPETADAPPDPPSETDQNGSEPAKVAKAKRTRSEPGKSVPVLEAYGMAMFAVHGFDPVANATLRSQACKLVDAIGAVDAPAVAEYYVLHEKEAWVLKNRHPFGELLKNCQKYYGNFKTNSKVTSGKAKATERNDSINQAVQEALAWKRSQSGGATP